MARGQDDGLAKLSDWKKTTDNYFRELQIKVRDLRQKLTEEKTINGELQEIACDLQGKVSVHYQRAEEQGVEHFKEIMEQAEKELQNTKLELEELFLGSFEAAKLMTKDFETYQAKFDDLAHRFKNSDSLDHLADLELDKCEEIKLETVNAETEILAIAKACEELDGAMLGYEGVDEVLKLYEAELELYDDQAKQSKQDYA